MNQTENIETFNGHNTFIPAKDGLLIILLALVGSLINYIPYNNMFSLMLQSSLLGGVFLLYRERPVMMIVAYIFLNILPSRMVGGFTEGALAIYALNSRICMVFAGLFLAYGILVLKKTYRMMIPTMMFVVIMILSLAWTVSTESYNYDFWWMCMAYLIWPLFINEDNDVRLVLISYVLAVDIFAVKVYPMLITQTNLYRGDLNLNPNYAAFVVLVSVALIFTIFSQYRDMISRKLTVFLIASMVMGIIFMSAFTSRSSLVILILLVVVFLLINFRQNKNVLQALIGITALFVILNQYGVFDAVLIRFLDPSTSTGAGRLPIQMELLQSIYNGDVWRFLLGNGFLTASYFGAGMQAHNSYISILFGFGLVGFVLYLAYLAVIYLRLKGGYYRSFLILFIFLCIYSFTLEPYHIKEGILFFCLLGGITNINCLPSSQKNMPRRDLGAR